MRNCYENIPSNQIEKQKKYLYGAMINILYLYDDGSPFVDATILNLRDQVLGLNALFNFQPQILTIVSNLNTAYSDHNKAGNIGFSQNQGRLAWKAEARAKK